MTNIEEIKLNEIIVALVKGIPTIGRCSGYSNRPKHIKVSTGRNQGISIPVCQVIMATGLVTKTQADWEAFHEEVEKLTLDINLEEVWEITKEQNSSMSLIDIAELYWGSSHQLCDRIALFVHLENDCVYFVAKNGSYVVRSPRHVENIQARSILKEKHEASEDSLVLHLINGQLPNPIDEYQQQILSHLRGYIIHGEDYTRRDVALKILKQVNSQRLDNQRFGFELLVTTGIFSPDEPIELEREGIPTSFSSKVLSEASGIYTSSVFNKLDRRDLTSMPTITIDDTGSSDRDDAISIEEVSNIAGEPTYRIGIHITDASALVPMGSIIDEEASNRMTAIYMPDVKIPMLPPSISSDKGSLVQNRTRLALSLITTVTKSGEIIAHQIEPSIIQSDAALSYEQADDALTEKTNPWYHLLHPLKLISESLSQRRKDSGAIEIDRPEMRIYTSESGEVSVKILRRTTAARKLITEYMILYNSLLAALCVQEGLPAAYRSQAHSELCGIMENEPDGPFRQYLMMRQLTPAHTSTEPDPHGGLGVATYTQSTSPLRRYNDLIMQRQVSSYLKKGEISYSVDNIACLTRRADSHVRKIHRMEEERKRYWFLRYLQQQMDQESLPGFKAVILESHSDRPALVELVEYPFRNRVSLPNSIDTRSEVCLRLHDVDLWRKEANFIFESTL